MLRKEAISYDVEDENTRDYEVSIEFQSGTSLVHIGCDDEDFNRLDVIFRLSRGGINKCTSNYSCQSLFVYYGLL